MFRKSIVIIKVSTMKSMIMAFLDNMTLIITFMYGTLKLKEKLVSRNRLKEIDSYLWGIPVFLVY